MLHPTDMHLLAELLERRPRIQTYQDFYDGKTKVTFTGADLQSKFGKEVEATSVNRCKPIIDLTLDKLSLEGWGDGDEASEDDQKADELWHELELDNLQHRVHFDALTKGDGYLLLWTDANDDLVVGVQEPDQIAVRWDAENPDEIEEAMKVWRIADGRWRLNKYTTTTLEKYVSRNPTLEPPAVENAWVKHEDEGDLAWPIQHSFGIVPLFHFKVTTRSSSYGSSDLCEIIPLQTKLNQTLAYQKVVAEQQSWRQRWVTGIQPIKDPESGEPISPFSAKADSIWAVASKDAKFGDFEEADLGMFEKVLEGDEARIARTARIPQHYLLQSGTPTSGESLKTAEAPFVSKIQARQRMFGLVWTRVIRYAMHFTHGNDLKQRFYPMWASAESRDETAMVQRKTLAQGLIAQGKYAAQALKELGYTHDQIEEFERLRVERIHEQSQRVLEGVM